MDIKKGNEILIGSRLQFPEYRTGVGGTFVELLDTGTPEEPEFTLLLSSKTSLNTTVRAGFRFNDPDEVRALISVLRALVTKFPE